MLAGFLCQLRFVLTNSEAPCGCDQRQASLLLPKKFCNNVSAAICATLFQPELLQQFARLLSCVKLCVFVNAVWGLAIHH